jgi:hypothetical protein
MGTNSDALSASQAAVFEEHQVRLRVLAFRIVAPPARQGTAFEENRGPNAGAIVQGVALDVEEKASRLRRGGVGGGMGSAADSELDVCSSHLSDSRSPVAHNIAPSIRHGQAHIIPFLSRRMRFLCFHRHSGFVRSILQRNYYSSPSVSLSGFVAKAHSVGF